MPPHETDPLQPHAHDPNPEPPTSDPTIQLQLPDGRSQPISLPELKRLPQTAVANCYIVSTGHGTSGPFTFSGVTLEHFIEAYVSEAWNQVEVVSADGFGNRVWHQEIEHPDPAGPILLAYEMNGSPMSRAQGLVRMIVPSERDDALRQVKWVRDIRVRP